MLEAVGSKVLQVSNFAQQLHNCQQHATGYANGRNMSHPTMLAVVAWQCCVRLRALSRDMINKLGITDVKYWIGSEWQRWAVFLDAVSVGPESYINRVPIGAFSAPVEFDKVTADIYQQCGWNYDTYLIKCTRVQSLALNITYLSGLILRLSQFWLQWWRKKIWTRLGYLLSIVSNTDGKLMDRISLKPRKHFSVNPDGSNPIFFGESRWITAAQTPRPWVRIPL